MADFAGLAGTDASKFHMTEILDGTVVYMRMPLLDGKLPGGKKWMKMDLQKLTKAFGVNLSQITQSGQDPAQQLGYLRTVADAKKVGSENVRGVPTTHYHGVARLDRYPELLPPDQRAAAREGIQRLIKVSGTSTMPVDAWIDKQGLIRRMRMAMNMKIPTIGQSMKMEIQEELFDFGTNVSVKPPPAKDVYDASGTINDALKQSGLGG